MSAATFKYDLGEGRVTQCCPRRPPRRIARVVRVSAAPSPNTRDLRYLLSQSTELSPLDFFDLETDELRETEVKLPDRIQKKKRGRKKGVPLDEANKKSIQAALKGKNKYKRTALHRRRVGLSVKRRWEERKAAGLKPKTKKCSICGKEGHNKQTCPQGSPADRTKHRRPRSFEHRWKLRESNKRAYAEKRSQPAKDDKMRVYRCSYCKEVGHSIKTCPKKRSEHPSMPRQDIASSISLNNAVSKERPMPIPKTSEVEDLKSLYTVPLDVSSMWQLALDCAVRAYRNGIGRQRMEFTFPLLSDGVIVDPMLSANNDMVRQFRVASLMSEAVLKGIKNRTDLKGRLDVGILDECESTVYWEGKLMSALLFPQPAALDIMMSRGMLPREKTPRLQLIVNPQWQPGQIVSDFGFGPLKALRERFVDSFVDVFYMKQLSIFGDVVIVMRCYPSRWQVHLVDPDGDIVLVGTSDDQPDFDGILGMLKKEESSVSRLNWIDQLKTKYIERRKTSPIFPLNVTKIELERCFENVDLSVRDRLNALNDGDASGSISKIKLLDTDIVTGEPVRDIKLDPLKQFTSFFGGS